MRTRLERLEDADLERLRRDVLRWFDDHAGQPPTAMPPMLDANAIWCQLIRRGMLPPPPSYVDLPFDQATAEQRAGADAWLAVAIKVGRSWLYGTPERPQALNRRPV